jgi:hypothetical protein
MADDESKKLDEEIIEIPDIDETLTTSDSSPEISSEYKDTTETESEPKKQGKIKKFWAKYLEKKKITIPLTVLVVVFLLFAIPFTRYSILGLFIKKSVAVNITDSETSRGVSEVTVTIDGKTGKTDGNGFVSIAGVRVGDRNVTVSKKYYKDLNSTVLVKLRGASIVGLKIQATGRQVPVKVTNSISKELVAGAKIKSGDSEAQTDEKGQATIVLSPNVDIAKATITKDGYNIQDVDITITDQQTDKNTFAITPAGHVYFLSKKSGKIDVVRSNLDGSDRKTVLAGTGNEDEVATSLLASRDWKYLALHSRRDDRAKLYLIDTSNDQLSTIDEGNAEFTPVGWYDHRFMFTINRNDIQNWQPKKSSLKAFNADDKQLIVIDDSRGEGNSDIDYATEQFGQVYILENELSYAKTWISDYYSGGRIVGKKNSINSVRPDGSSKRVVRDFDAKTSTYINSKLYEPQAVYYELSDATLNVFYEYEDGQLKEDPKITQETFNKFYPTFLVSPSGTKTFWYESRDGKNTLFIGDKNAENNKEIATLSEYQPYGWFGDEYVLVSKSGSELYVGTPGKVDSPLKISDYHKPNNAYTGYGYGYGGL